ncbi:MAG: hypothetical protein AAFN74_27315, partial [Myxococcota bacterium]
FDTGERASLALSGESAPAGQLECTPSTFDLGEVPRGEEVVTVIDCEAVGGPYVLEDVRFTSESSSAFRINSRPEALDANNRLRLQVFFTSDSVPSLHEAVLEIRAEHGAVTRINAAAQMVAPAPSSTTISLEIRWNTQTDFDLHLVREGGVLFDEVEDCHFLSKNPDWGLPNEKLDDPFLDNDEAVGFGPELLNLSRPAESQYDVYVQYHGFVGDFTPSTTVDIEIGLNGQAPLLRQRLLSECGLMWHVGRINVVDGVAAFESINTVSTDYQIPATTRCGRR